MLYFKACGRCRGDMHSNRDIYGHYMECLQCGFILQLDTPRRRFAQEAVRTTKKTAA